MHCSIKLNLIQHTSCLTSCTSRYFFTNSSIFAVGTKIHSVTADNDLILLIFLSMGFSISVVIQAISLFFVFI